MWDKHSGGAHNVLPSNLWGEGNLSVAACIFGDQPFFFQDATKKRVCAQHNLQRSWGGGLEWPAPPKTVGWQACFNFSPLFSEYLDIHLEIDHKLEKQEDTF